MQTADPNTGTVTTFPNLGFQERREKRIGKRRKAETETEADPEWTDLERTPNGKRETGNGEPCYNMSWPC
jgi:hypothetical protein